MQTSAIWGIAALITAAIGFGNPCLAGDNNALAKSQSALQALANSAIPTAELGRQSARGFKSINVDTSYTFDGALSNGALRGNAVIGSNDSGMITTTNSINNNTGITTVFQNSGHNSLFQQSTSIIITVR